MTGEAHSKEYTKLKTAFLSLLEQYVKEDAEKFAWKERAGCLTNGDLSLMMNVNEARYWEDEFGEAPKAISRCSK